MWRRSSSDEDEDDDKDKAEEEPEEPRNKRPKFVPQWAQAENLTNALLRQSEQSPRRIFGDVRPPDMAGTATRGAARAQRIPGLVLKFTRFSFNLRRLGPAQPSLDAASGRMRGSS